MLEQLLKVHEVQFGIDHFITAVTMANLAITYGLLGDQRKKVELIKRALKIVN